MTDRILLTTTSFQDTPGPHHAALEAAGWDVVTERGPLPESRMLELMGDFDGLICGDDDLTYAVMEKALPRLRVISKYGIGVDRIDVPSATKLGLPVCYTPGVNHTTVAEHTFALMLALSRHVVDEAMYTRQGLWKRISGHDIGGKTLGVVGFGRIGQEVVKRARGFEMNVVGLGNYWDQAFAEKYQVKRAGSIDELLEQADILSLNTSLTEKTRGMISRERLSQIKPEMLIVNCARGGLVDEQAVADALHAGTLAGYAADVLTTEPPEKEHPLLSAPRCVITPHIGSRTHESVARQAGMTVENTIRAMRGEQPVHQLNDVPIKQSVRS